MDKEFARGRLLDLLKPGDTVATFVQHVSRGDDPATWVRVIISAGMLGNPGPSDISALVAAAIGVKYSPRGYPGVPVYEIGTDPSALVLLDLGRALWRDGWACIGDGCPSAEHYGRTSEAPRMPGLVHRDVQALNHNRF